MKYVVWNTFVCVSSTYTVIGQHVTDAVLQLLAKIFPILFFFFCDKQHDMTAVSDMEVALPECTSVTYTPTSSQYSLCVCVCACRPLT